MLMVWQAPGGDDPRPRLGLAGASCPAPARLLPYSA